MCVMKAIYLKVKERLSEHIPCISVPLKKQVFHMQR